MSCSGNGNCNEIERLLGCICDKIFELHQMLDGYLVQIINELVNINGWLSSINSVLNNINITLGNINSLLVSIDSTLLNIQNDLNNGFSQVINLLGQLLACCQASSASSSVLRQPTVISFNPSSIPLNRISNAVGLVPGGLFLWVQFRNVGANPAMVNGFYVPAGGVREYRVNGNDKIGPISYDCTGGFPGGTGVTELEIEGLQ